MKLEMDDDDGKEGREVMTRTHQEPNENRMKRRVGSSRWTETWAIKNVEGWRRDAQKWVRSGFDQVSSPRRLRLGRGIGGNRRHDNQFEAESETWATVEEGGSCFPYQASRWPKSRPGAGPVWISAWMLMLVCVSVCLQDNAITQECRGSSADVQPTLRVL